MPNRWKAQPPNGANLPGKRGVCNALSLAMGTKFGPIKENLDSEAGTQHLERRRQRAKQKAMATMASDLGGYWNATA